MVEWGGKGEAVNLRVDLHLHTTASDGRWPPERLVAEVRQAGIGLFAVTDHDSLESLAPTLRLVRGSGLNFLPGVELSSQWEGQWYHLLAYGVDGQDADFRAFVAANQARLRQVGDDAIALLVQAGWPIPLDEYETYTWDRRRGGWKALNFLLDYGFCADLPGYFALFQEVGFPPTHFATPPEIVAAAQRAGGVVILAHPGAYFTNGLDRARLDRLIEAGVQGLECYSSHHDAARTGELVDYCRRRDLLITGGSDFHGGFAGRALGQPPLYLDDLRLGVLPEMVISA